MTFRPNPPLSRLLTSVRRNAESPVYLVGGTLRDGLLKRATADLDLAVVGSAENLARRLARELKGTLVVLDEATRVYRIALPRTTAYKTWSQIDVAQAQDDDIEKDLLRRDFTVNAMAWQIFPKGDGRLLDPRGGLKDLKRKLIRADNPAVFREDPLRLLRAFRQAAQLGFRLDPSTSKHLRKYRTLARKPAGERIHQELLGILSSPGSRLQFTAMDEAGILTSLFPEFEKCRRCAQVYYGAGGVLRHCLDTMERMDFLLVKLDTLFPDIANKIREHLGQHAGTLERAQSLLRLGALLHDIAKPATARKVGGRLRFFGHDVLGAQQAMKLLNSFRFSKNEIAIIAACIRHHLRPGNLAANPVVSNKAVFRFFGDVGSHGVALLLVCWADHASYLSPAALHKILSHAGKDPHGFPLHRMRGADVRKTLHHLQVVGFLLRAYFQRRQEIQPPKLLDGHAVMKALKIPAGPAVGKALNLLQEAQVEGKVVSRAQAIEFLNKKRSLLIGPKT